MKKTFVLTLILGIASLINAQIVNISDANFKAYLVANSEINTNGDSQIQVSEANAFAGTINIYDKGITNLTGIEAFVNITGLSCYSESGSTFPNQLTSLDISKNTKLKTLLCYGNLLTSLDVSKNIDLITIFCYDNQLTNLDVSKNTELLQLYCGNNPLKTLDISNNLKLIQLYCYQNQLTSLDISKNTALKYLNCQINQLTNLNINNITTLMYFFCYDNLLTSLDFSKNTNLRWLECYNNKLTNLILKNGNNENLIYMYSYNNPQLNCIEVDNIANASSNSGWQKDATASYNTNCILAVNDINKIEITIYPNPAKDILNFSQDVSNFRISDLSGKVVKQISSSEKSINVSKLAKGNYIISGKTKTGETINKKFIKE
ncbi:T9SS type A sorting domain-containing protein [Epilithonimonas zeae]|uniref:Por secretion system C-terminal sorting domain-containing protein n=1 Tax=Epilithonimonas zeae TaxID=1416779 RepID=A0A1N6IA57_9FLAO|nr:T9SS type A sorting domain-containing protein [Epilithonimonas zeae]SIO28916.1 Por secretion system C-terminal sorting domain-containing protein [Epilithonimonas zeae]